MIYFILLLGLVLRLVSINQSIWLDEGTTAMVSRMNLTEIFKNFLIGDFHPPLYYIFIKFWTLIFGNSEISLRFPSVLFSLGTIYLIHKLWLILIGRKNAWIAPLLLSTSGLFIYYSQEARMYILSTFFATLSIFSFVKINNKESRLGDWILFSISLAFLSMSDYLPNLLILVFWIMAVGNLNNIYWIKKFIMSHIILVVSWLWWLPFFTKQLVNGFAVSSDHSVWWNILGKFSFKEIVLIPTKFIIGRISIEPKWLYGLVVIWLIIIFGYFLHKARNKAKLIWLWLTFPIVLTILISLKVPVLSYNRLLFVLPAFYILVAGGISTFKKPWRVIFLVIVLCVNLLTSSVYLLNFNFHREDWRGVSELDDVVVFPKNSQTEGYLYYSNGKKPLIVEEIDSCLDKLWLVRYVWEISDPDDLAKKKVEEMGYKKTREENFRGILLYFYEKI